MRRSDSSRNLYTPNGAYDAEVAGNVIEGNQRNDTALTSFLPFRRVPRMSVVSSQSIRDECAPYFTTELGEVPWQQKYS
ncbi:hypothetical protein ANN_27832 [Periplaneta americana]|uniref:Uncharacterized protein n=1 Tax=Periplaneta americana TaxID=6978 RepID=A0ABQ8RV99_PERAM|nr:hypothetical protein ANN_27832 [Periplaneta americana]